MFVASGVYLESQLGILLSYALKTLRRKYELFKGCGDRHLIVSAHWPPFILLHEACMGVERNYAHSRLNSDGIVM